jgi:hypothetical protein
MMALIDSGQDQVSVALATGHGANIPCLKTSAAASAEFYRWGRLPLAAIRDALGLFEA